MKKNFGSEIKIISIIVVIFMIVAVTAVMTYNGFRGIVNEVSHASRPEIKLSLLKQVLSDITSAENSVKSYNLTHDSKYLSPFYRSVLTIDSKMEELKVAVSDNEEQKELLAKMSMLIDKKYDLLNELLALHADESIIDELTGISDKIQRETEKAQVTENKDLVQKEQAIVKKEERKQNFFKRLFGKKEKPAATPVISQDSVVKADLKKVQKNIRQEILKVNLQHLNEIKQARQMELLITAKNESLMENIKSLVSEIEGIEKKLIAEKIEKAKKQAEDTNNLVALFCGLAAALLLTVGLVIINYVRKRNAMNVQLTLAKDKAENIARAREIFLANMSHELRTPMNAILGFTNEVLQTDLSHFQREQLVIVKKSQDHLLNIVNDVLDYSKITAGKFTFAKIDFDAGEIINEVVKLSSALVKNKEVTLGVALNNAGDLILRGDPTRLRQIVLNLLGNSIKFTSKGTIEVCAKQEIVNENEVVLHLLISDTGIGIPKDKIKKVLEEFEQTDESVYIKYGGTGLGLPITKKLVELQGGMLQIESELGVGTKMNITIPYGRGSIDRKNEEHKVVPKQNWETLKNRKVLIADDNGFNRTLLHAILLRQQIQITEVENGREVLEAVTQNEYDLVLTDVRMPEMSGLEATEAIRKLADPKKSNVPIIALTATNSAEKNQECMDSGMNDFLSKPFKEDELFSKMIRLLGQRAEERK